MSDATVRLTAALDGRYSIERELGAGGMATVYLAEDVRHHRKVALKVLRPDLAATLGPERFLREIEIAANLTHPHVLPLYDSGEADGFLFYVLPYIEGESLRDRLVREGELPIGEVVRILRDVVDALAHAHDQGVVHRDIKPDNVMLSGRHALVTDFGVAKAVSEATGRHQLTTVGVALGTPAYMSPEQAEASDHIDHRADIYAVGALAYELLAGRPPFVHKSPQLTLVAHVTEAPKPVTVHRDSAPPALAELVMRCLEKKPADRWQSAEEMLGHLEALATPSGGLTPTATMPVSAAAGGGGLFTPMKIVAAAAVVVAVVAVGSLVRSGGGSGAGSVGAELDPNVVVIVPFRFSGPEELDYVGDGVVDLLAARLTGEVGPRAVDPAGATAVWAELSEADPTRATDGLARRFGAGLTLTGSVVADPSGLNVSASLSEVSSTSDLASTSVQGPADSLAAIVDRLAAGLLSLSTGEYEESLDQLTSTSPEALREYLLGQREYKRVRFALSSEHFRRAVQLDSTFALAAIGWADAAWNGLAVAPGALPLAWRHRDRLSERDRAYLRARVGPNYPDPATVVEQIRAWETALELAPDRAQIWYGLGELYVHGLRDRTEEWSQRTGRYFERALELDSRHGVSAMHLFMVDLDRDDLPAARKDLELISALAATAEQRVWPAFLIAVTSPDTSGFGEAHEALLASSDLTELAASAWLISLGIARDTFAVRAVGQLMDELLLRPMTSTESSQVHRTAYQFFLDVGRPGRADRVLGRWEVANGNVLTRRRLLDAVYGPLSEESRVVVSASMEQRLSGLSQYSVTDLRDLIALELGRLSQGDLRRTRETVETLTQATQRFPEARALAWQAAAFLFEARLAEEERNSEVAQETLEQVEDLFLRGLPLGDPQVEHGLFFLMASLQERLGSPESALSTLDWEKSFLEGRPYVGRFLRERGRLAALTGDTERAIREYELYLRLRYDPEPELEAEVEEVRRALAELTGG